MTQETALKKMKSGKNIFLTGRAGTGKTYILSQYIKYCEENKKTVLRTAPTGIASLNLTSVTSENEIIIGKTLHTAFAIPIPAYGKREIVLSKVPKETRTADVIIIDEISMCRNDVFEYVAQVLEKIKKIQNTMPQIIVCGDFYQLPPVIPEDEKKRLKRFGLDPSGYAFMSPYWKKFKFVFCELDKIYRQNDSEFIENLGKLRIGDISCIEYFNQHVVFDIPKDSTIICSTNTEANKINEEQLGLIEGPRCAYECIRTGRTAKEYNVDDTIFLKPGCKVIFMTNDNINHNYQNGTIGEVLQCYDKTVLVKVNNKEFTVYPYEWKAYNITISNGQVNKKEIGSYTQLPLKLAYAITMHKTQGQTYDKCVVSPNSFADGQLYVALSRVKTIEGLYLTDYIQSEYIKVNSLVKDFYENHEIKIPDWIIKKKADLNKKVKTKNTRKTSKSKTNKNTKITKSTKIRKNADKNTTKSVKTVKKKPQVKKKTVKTIKNK